MDNFKDRYFSLNSNSKASVVTYAPLVVLVTCAICFSFSAWHLRSHGQQLNSLQMLRQGLGICGTRLSQSLVALQARSYLSAALQKDFLEKTDTCFTEVKGLYRSLEGKVSVSDVSKEMTLLTDGVFIFNQKISEVVANSESRQGRNHINDIGSRYNDLENYRYGVDQKIAKNIQLMMKGQTLWEILVAASFLAVTLIGLFFFVSRKKLIDEISPTASDQHPATAKDPGPQNFEPAEFASFYGSGLTLDQAAEENQPQPEEPVTATTDNAKGPELLEDRSGNYKPISLLQVFNKTKTMLTMQDTPVPFNIVLDINFCDVDLLGDDESLEQLFFNVMSKIIANYQINPTEKASVTISSQLIDDKGLVIFNLRNILFTAHDLENQSGDMNTVMINELVSQLKGKVEFKNILVSVKDEDQHASLILELPANPVFEEELQSQERPKSKKFISSLFSGKKSHLKDYLSSQKENNSQLN